MKAVLEALWKRPGKGGRKGGLREAALALGSSPAAMVAGRRPFRGAKPRPARKLTSGRFQGDAGPSTGDRSATARLADVCNHRRHARHNPMADLEAQAVQLAGADVGPEPQLASQLAQELIALLDWDGCG
jgi:hypothetical protein